MILLKLWYLAQSNEASTDETHQDEIPANIIIIISFCQQVKSITVHIQQ